MSQPIHKVKTTQLSTHPFKKMENIKSHTSEVYDCAGGVLFPDGKTKIVTCSWDKTIRIFDLETLKCEKIINHSSWFYSILFYKEKNVLMTTDDKGELILWDFFSFPNYEMKKIKIIKVDESESHLWRLTQISSDLFCCCCSSGPSPGSLFSIKFNNYEENDIKVEEIKYRSHTENNNKEWLCSIYKLKNENNSIIYAGGRYYNGVDFTIRKYNFKTKKHLSFQKKHSFAVLCLTSFIDENSEEIVLSGSFDQKIMFWNLEGQKLKEIILNAYICSFLNDSRRNNIFLSCDFGGFDILYSLNLKTYKVVKVIDKIHDDWIYCMKWIDKSRQNRFVSCSVDSTFSVFELEDISSKEEREDLKERVSFIRDEEFIQKYFCSENNKKMLFSVKFWNNFEIENIFKVLFV